MRCGLYFLLTLYFILPGSRLPASQSLPPRQPSFADSHSKKRSLGGEWIPLVADDAVAFPDPSTLCTPRRSRRANAPAMHKLLRPAAGSLRRAPQQLMRRAAAAQSAGAAVAPSVAGSSQPPPNLPGRRVEYANIDGQRHDDGRYSAFKASVRDLLGDEARDRRSCALLCLRH